MSSEYDKNRYAKATPEQKKKLNESTKTWRKNNPEKIREIRKRTDAKRKERKRHTNLMREYGISLEQYNEFLKFQNGVCAICKQPETQVSRHGTPLPLCVDHCHTSGKVRGLLCRSCNLGIGNLKDSIDNLLNAILYLKEHHGS